MVSHQSIHVMSISSLSQDLTLSSLALGSKLWIGSFMYCSSFIVEN